MLAKSRGRFSTRHTDKPVLGMLRKLAGHAHYRYVIINTSVSVIAFGRNLLFMKTLGLADLGQVALMQTIVMLVGFVQLGAINGAYILFAERKPEQSQRIVNVLSMGVVGLLAVTTIAVILGGGRILEPVVAQETLVIGVFGGICTLASTWMNNALIAKGALGKSNVINMGAVLVSLAVAAMSLEYGLLAALLSMLLQPALVGLVALIIEPDLRPSSLRVHSETFRSILSLGIMAFAGMLFVLMTYQLERWSIVFVLGGEALGEFYLVIMYMSFFLLIPISLLNVHFPLAMRAYQAKEYDDFRAILRRHFIEISIYGVAVLLVTVALLPVAVSAFAPQFSDSQYLVFLVFPALFIFVMQDSAALVLYSVKRTQPILVSGVIMLVTYAVLLGAAAAFDIFNLAAVVVLRGVAVLISTAYLLWVRQDIIRNLA